MKAEPPPNGVKGAAHRQLRRSALRHVPGYVGASPGRIKAIPVEKQRVDGGAGEGDHP